MSRTDPKQARLAKLDLFKNADRKALDHLASTADEVTVEAGHQLIEQGHRHNEVFILESGSATVEVGGNKVAEIPAGELVGELAFFTRAPATATVTTSAETTLLVIPYNRFDQILNDNPRLVRDIAAELAQRLLAADARM